MRDLVPSRAGRVLRAQRTIALPGSGGHQTRAIGPGNAQCGRRGRTVSSDELATAHHSCGTCGGTLQVVEVHGTEVRRCVGCGDAFGDTCSICGQPFTEGTPAQPFNESTPGAEWEEGAIQIPRSQGMCQRCRDARSAG